MTEFKQLREKFEAHGSTSTTGAASLSSGKPLANKKPAVSPKLEAKVKKLSPSLVPKIEGSSPPKRLVSSDREARVNGDHRHKPQKSLSADSPSTSLSALANVIRNSPSPTTPRRAPPSPPTTAKPRLSPPSPPIKPRLLPVAHLDTNRGEKTKSMDVTRLQAVKGPSAARPFSTSVDHRVNLHHVSTDKPVPPAKPSPTVDSQHKNLLSMRKQTSLSSSYKEALNSLVHIDSPFMPRRTSDPHSPSETSPPQEGSLQQSRNNVTDRNKRATSLPRYSLSPPPVETPGNQLLPQTKGGKSRSDLHLNRIMQKPDPPPKKGLKPSTAPKPVFHAKPLVPRKPPSTTTNLKDEHSRRSSSSSREATPEASKARCDSREGRVTPEARSNSRVTSVSSEGRRSSSRETTPGPMEERSESIVLRFRDTDQESKGTGTESSEEERIKSPETSSERRKPPEVDILVVPATSVTCEQGESSGRGNVDSGFISEPADDLMLGRDVSVDSSVSNEEKEGAAVKEPEVWDEARLEKARKKRENIAQELLDTERTYVSRLELIAVTFYNQVDDFNTKNKQVIPPSDVQQMFLNIRQIHQLNQNILQELQTRMDNWSKEEGLGDVFCRLAPFLKLYSTYTSGFEDAMKLLTEWTAREKKFDSLVRDFARQTSSGLGVSHYMLEPVQRIPRYRLLLADYLKYLPEDSPDRPATAKALGIISEAADRTNDRIKELENSNTVLQIQRSLQDYEGSLLGPSRIFLKKGMLMKFSRKTPTPRMFFLFSDKLLHTYPSGTDIYKFKNEMPIYGMQVDEPTVSLTPFSFNVHSTTRSLILVANSEEEKQEWMTALKGAIDDDLKKRSSLRRGSMYSVKPQKFGAKAPIMVPDKSVTMCQVCSTPFTFTFRRHHCRACGKVVCGNCSQWKAFLIYMEKTERVCERCFKSSKESRDKTKSQDETDAPKALKKPEKGILNLKAYPKDTVIAGYVLSQEGRRWTKLWYLIRQDLVLYKFRAHEDIKAINSMPLPGYIVTPDRGSSTINLIHPSSKKQLCDSFRVEDPAEFDHWVSALEKVVHLEIPTQSDLSPPGIPVGERKRSRSVRDDLETSVGEDKNSIEKQQSV